MASSTEAQFASEDNASQDNASKDKNPMGTEIMENYRVSKLMKQGKKQKGLGIILYKDGPSWSSKTAAI